jgi:L-rhamnose-H+ transport protein
MLILGFALAGRAGLAREAGAADKTGKAAEKKVSKLLVVVVVLWSGFANALYYFTFEFQRSMKAIATEQFHVKDYEWGFLNIVPFFLGMFTVNLILTVVKMTKDGTLKNYSSAPGLPREYVLGFVIALLWYLGQGVAYPAGQGVLGPLGVAVGAALFMGMIMVVANIAGIRTGEWKGASSGTMRILYAAIVVLVLAVAVIAAGNYLQQHVFEVK